MDNVKPIRIAQVMGKWVGGGVEAVIMNYYRNMDRNKIQFDFIFDNDSDGIPYEEIEKLGGRVILCPPYQRLFKYIKELKIIFKEEKYTIVHSNINTMSVFPLYAAKHAKVPVRIAHNHSTSNKKEWKKNVLKALLKPFSKIYATDYFACSEHAGKWLFGNKALKTGKIVIINNGIEINNYIFNENIRKNKRQELGIEDDEIVIGHVGRFVKQKNHNFLIDVFNEIHKKNNKSKLVLIGQGPLENRIKQKVKDCRLNDSVLFLGQQNNVNDYYNIMDVFLFPSLYEGLGIATIEAQINGLGCLVSNNVPKDIIISSGVKFLDFNIGEWTTNIEEFTGRKFELNERRDIFDISKQVKKIEDYYWSKVLDI